MTSTRLADRPRNTPRLRGDETELYRTHHRAVLARTRRAVNAPEQLIEDACQLAWLQLLRYQPEPRVRALAWLTVVARHEAYRLARQQRAEPAASNVTVIDEHGVAREVDPDRQQSQRGDPELAHELSEALRALAGLKPAQRTTLALKAAGYRYREIQQLCGGRTYTWVNRHITEGRAAMRALITTGNLCAERWTR